MHTGAIICVLKDSALAIVKSHEIVRAINSKSTRRMRTEHFLRAGDHVQ